LPGTGDDTLESALGGLTGTGDSGGQQDLSTILVPPSNMHQSRRMRPACPLRGSLRVRDRPAGSSGDGDVLHGPGCQFAIEW
jgi:hypothetical protein